RRALDAGCSMARFILSLRAALLTSPAYVCVVCRSVLHPVAGVPSPNTNRHLMFGPSGVIRARNDTESRSFIWLGFASRVTVGGVAGIGRAVWWGAVEAWGVVAGVH